jgi:hypothetical protein
MSGRRATQMNAVPVKDLRPLADWRDELGLDRLTADLINGDLDAYHDDPLTGEYHPIPRAHWEGEKAVVHAIAHGWPIGGGLFFPDIPFRVCAIHAARPGSSKRPKQHRKRTQEGIIRRVREAYPNGVGDTSTAEICRTISEKGYNPSWDSVHRALGRKKSANQQC